jgi:hypothetical protein
MVFTLSVPEYKMQVNRQLQFTSSNLKHKVLLKKFNSCIAWSNILYGVL